MKNKPFIFTLLLTFFLFTSSEEALAKTNDSFVFPIRELTDEKKTNYFHVTINIQEEDLTPSPYNKVRDDYKANKKASTINVPANGVDGTLDVLYLIMEKDEMLNREAQTLKNIKIELRSETEVTLIQEFPIGIYKNTWLKIGNNITIDGSTTSPMLTNTKKREVNPYTNIPNYTPYDYNSNIVIEGGIWDSNRDENKVTSQGFTLGNASNVYVKNVIIKDVAGGHGIDAAGVNGLVIENSQFLGSALIGGNSDRDYNEAIQLDQMASSGPFGGSSTSWGYFDGTVTKNVYIANNIFGASHSPSTVPWHVGIGSHSVVKGVPYENITIYKNNFYSMDNAGIRMTNYKNVLVANNNFRKNDHGIKIYSTNYAFDYSDKDVNKNVLYPAVNDTITIRKNTFNYIGNWGTNINSVGYSGGANGLTKNVHILNNTYQNSSLLKAFYQYYAQNTKISEAHYDINGYLLSKTHAVNYVNQLKAKGKDANYALVYDQQLYQVSIPKRFTSLAVANNTAYLIKKGKGVNAMVKTEGKGKYYVYTDYVIGAKRAKEIEYFIEKDMQFTYSANSFNANHPNNLYRVGLQKRFNTYAQAKKASDDLYRIAKANSVITKEKTGKYYVKTSSLVGKNRAEQVTALMKKKTSYNPSSYNTNQMAYYKITVHPFYGKAEAIKQALYLKNQYNLIESIPVLTKD